MPEFDLEETQGRLARDADQRPEDAGLPPLTNPAAVGELISAAERQAQRLRVGGPVLPIREPLPVPPGPGWVKHLPTEGSHTPRYPQGLAACTGDPISPVPTTPGTVIYPCTGCTVVGPKLTEERRLANLGNATTREMLEELAARGDVHGGYDGRFLARQVRVMLLGDGALSAAVLDYRTTGELHDVATEPPGWHDLQIVAESGYFTVLDRCTYGCRHTSPQAALACTALADEKARRDANPE